MTSLCATPIGSSLFDEPTPSSDADPGGPDDCIAPDMNTASQKVSEDTCQMMLDDDISSDGSGTDVVDPNDPDFVIEDGVGNEMGDIKREKTQRNKHGSAYLARLRATKEEDAAQKEKAFEALMETLRRAKSFGDCFAGKDQMKTDDKVNKRAIGDDCDNAPGSKKMKFGETSSSQNVISQNQIPKPDHDVVDMLSTIEAPVMLTGAVLRPYQMHGMKWLVRGYLKGINCILADEMGLGKTIQCLATVCHLIENDISGPFLVCAPLSTLSNWVKEAQIRCPKLPVSLYHGKADERQLLYQQYFPNNSRDPCNTLVVTSYEIIMKDATYLKNIKWTCLIIDEAHRIKNFRCKLIEKLNICISAFRILLTGTPLQNNLRELWSLLNFVMPNVFFNLATFESWFQVSYLEQNAATDFKEQEKKVLAVIHEILAPFLLRRLKKDVEISIPGKKELLVYCPMSQLQTFMYRSAAESTLRDVVDNKDSPKKFWEERQYENFCEALKSKKDIKDATEPEIESKISTRQDIRMECDTQQELSPIEKCNSKNEDLTPTRRSLRNKIRKHGAYKTVEPKNTKEKEIHMAEYEKMKIYGDGVDRTCFKLKTMNPLMLLRKIVNHPYLIEWPVNIFGDMVINDYVVHNCGKMRVLDAILPKLKADGHKVLLFCQMTEMMDILEMYLSYRRYSFVRLDGTMKLEERATAIQSFTEKNIFVFLLSTRAGGQGINLTAADTVIIYDSDWNPQMDLQAQDRCHRIGQTLPVVVYRMVSKGTVDEKIVSRAGAKKKLEKMIIEKGKFSSGQTTKAAFSMDELIELLNSKDEEYFASETQDADVFSKAQLNELLNREDLFLPTSAPEKSDAIYKVMAFESAIQK